MGLTVKMPQCHLAYAPRGAGLLLAMTYLVDQDAVAGWWIGHRDASYHPAYFLLENYYSARPTRFLATSGSDLYGGWHFDYARAEPRLADPVPVNDALCHHLERTQDAFAGEWLFFRGNPGAEAEFDEYARRELGVQDVGIRCAQLDKLDRSDVVWTYRSHDFDFGLLDFLSLRWPLEYRRAFSP
jgi:hypothetical protein